MPDILLGRASCSHTQSQNFSSRSKSQVPDLVKQIVKFKSMMEKTQNISLTKTANITSVPDHNNTMIVSAVSNARTEAVNQAQAGII